MKPHESPPPPESLKKQFVAIWAIRGLCGIGVLDLRYEGRSQKCNSETFNNFISCNLRLG